MRLNERQTLTPKIPERGIRYAEIDVDRDRDARKFMTTVLGVPAVPATVLGTRLLPGFKEVEFAQIAAQL